MPGAFAMDGDAAGDTTLVEIALPQMLPVGEHIVEILLGDEESGLATEYI